MPDVGPKAGGFDQHLGPVGQEKIPVLLGEIILNIAVGDICADMVLRRSRREEGGAFRSRDRAPREQCALPVPHFPGSVSPAPAWNSDTALARNVRRVIRNTGNMYISVSQK